MLAKVEKLPKNMCHMAMRRIQRRKPRFKAPRRFMRFKRRFLDVKRNIYVGGQMLKIKLTDKYFHKIFERK